MRTLRRYVLLALGIPIYFWLLLADFGSQEEWNESDISFWTGVGESERLVRNYGSLPCTFQSCFNVSHCRANQLKVYVYPSQQGDIQSQAYGNVLAAIRESAYYTADYTEACLFVLSLDTIDRDIASQNYVKDVNSYISNLPKEIWNGGLNHVVFNLYHGTFPDYADHNLGFNTGKAIIARASPSVQHFRFGFDVSFPLFHPEHNLRTGLEKFMKLSTNDRHLISFKGKRYVYGIGSETRDALHHLHNGESVAMVTTCKHNTDWKNYQDERCEQDNAEYEKWDYQETMANSTFCLTPRGRRLGSFRFLESLRTGCIPVVLSDDWVLPFAEVLDWTAAVVVIPEENVLLVPEILRSMPEEQVTRMKEQGRFLYNRYFRDVEVITLTTLRIVFERVRRGEGFTKGNWNKLPSYMAKSGSTALVILGENEESIKSWANAKKTEEINQIFVVWPLKTEMPIAASEYIKYIRTSELVSITAHSPATKFVFLDERIKPRLKDIQAVLRYLEMYPERLIGTHGVDYDPILETVNFAEMYNAVYPSIMAVHRESLSSLLEAFPRSLLEECFAAALNVFVSDNSMQPPIVIGKRPVEAYMQNSKNPECWKKVASRWTNGAPLSYSTFHYA